MALCQFDTEGVSCPLKGALSLIDPGIWQMALIVTGLRRVLWYYVIYFLVTGPIFKQERICYICFPFSFFAFTEKADIRENAPFSLKL